MSDLIQGRGTITNAALIVEIDGQLRQAILPHPELLQLVNVAEALNDGRLVLSAPLPGLRIPQP